MTNEEVRAAFPWLPLPRTGRCNCSKVGGCGNAECNDGQAEIRGWNACLLAVGEATAARSVPPDGAAIGTAEDRFLKAANAEWRRRNAVLADLLNRARAYNDGTWPQDTVREIDAALAEGYNEIGESSLGNADTARLDWIESYRGLHADLMNTLWVSGCRFPIGPKMTFRLAIDAASRESSQVSPEADRG